MADERTNTTGEDRGTVAPGVQVQDEAAGGSASTPDSNSGNGDAELSQEKPAQDPATQPQTTLSPEKMNEVINNYVKDALSQEIVAYNALEIKKKYPKTYDLMVEYMNKTAHVSSLDMETIVGVLLYSPRNVIFNFFDGQKIFVNIFGSDEHWRYTMEANESSEETFVNRTLCEIAGYEEAFKRLEQKLNSKP